MNDSTSQPCSRAAKSAKSTSLSRAIKHSNIDFQLSLTPHFEVFPLKNRILTVFLFSVELSVFLCKFCEDSKLKTLSSTQHSQALATSTCFSFVTRILIGSCVVRSAF